MNKLYEYASWRKSTNRNAKGVIPVSTRDDLHDCIQATFDYLGWYEPFVVLNKDGEVEYETHGGE